MPVNAYYGGNGKKVMAAMVREYGPVKGERVFYATAAKQGEKPKVKRRKKPA